MAVKAIDALLARAWAITPEGMEQIASIAEREHVHAGNLEALEAKLGRPLANTQGMTIRDGVALLQVQGPTFAKANLFTRISGATSYDILATDFTAALEDPNVRAIVGVFDTPGGEVTGASELAAMFKAARGKKPMVAFVEGQMASAGYWTGSAFDKIIAADTGMIGSIGAQLGFRITEPKAGEKSYRFVSSVSPNKNASPETEEGAASYQRIADDMGQVFVNTVAANRNVTVEKVLESFGQGAVFVAADALERGMIDGIGTLESVISDLSKPKGKSMDYASLTAEQLAANRPDLVAAIGDQAVAKAGVDVKAAEASAATAERTRITEIMSAAEGIDGAESIVTAAIADPAKTSASVAIDLLKHVKAAGATTKPTAAANHGQQHLAALQDAEKSQPMPNPSAESAPVSDIEKGNAQVEALRKQGLIA